MSKAEEKALELFPVDMQMCVDETGELYEADMNDPRRKYVAYGYEQAEKDTIERVIDWVRKNAYIYTDTQNDEEGNLMTVFLERAFIDDLTKAMEEEK